MLHLPKLLLHALPGAIASAQLCLLKLLPEGVSLKIGSITNVMGLYIGRRTKVLREVESRQAPPLISCMLDA